MFFFFFLFGSFYIGHNVKCLEFLNCNVFTIDFYDAIFEYLKALPS